MVSQMMLMLLDAIIEFQLKSFRALCLLSASIARAIRSVSNISAAQNSFSFLLLVL
jgi:hypothetical protein